MASEIRVDKINSLSGVGTVTLSPTGVDIAGITTVATLRATTGIVTSLTAAGTVQVAADNSHDLGTNSVRFRSLYAHTLYGNGANITGIDLDAVTGATGDFSIADKIIHTGDTNTAIRFPAADTFTVETAGSERVRIDSNGDIGVNVTTINRSDAGRNTIQFDYSGSDGSEGLEIRLSNSALNGNAATDNAAITYIGQNLGITNRENGNIQFSNNGNEVLRIVSDRHILTQGLTGTSFNNDGANTKILEVTGDGTVGEYGQLNLSGNQNSSAAVGSIKFINRENSNSSSGANANSRNLATIDVYADTSDSNAGDDCGGFIRFVTKSDGGGNSERARITSDGDLKIVDGNLVIGTAGHGINFSATSDTSGATSELLDDYEEGTYTPAIVTNGTNPTLTYTSQVGRYTRVGNLVYVTFDINYTNKTDNGSGTVFISLPITANSASVYHLSALRGARNTALPTSVTQYQASHAIIPNSAYFEPNTNDGGGNATTITGGNLATSGRIVGSCVYQA